MDSLISEVRGSVVLGLRGVSWRLMDSYECGSRVPLRVLWGLGSLGCRV